MHYKTNQRELLFSFLRNDPHKSYSTEEIYKQLSADGISQSAIYRNLARLSEDGLVTKTIQSGSRRAYYRYAGSSMCHNKVHLVCKNCGRVFHMDNRITCKLQNDLQNFQGFELDTVETCIFGYCRDCAHAQQ